MAMIGYIGPWVHPRVVYTDCNGPPEDGWVMHASRAFTEVVLGLDCLPLPLGRPDCVVDDMRQSAGMLHPNARATPVRP